MTRRLSLGFERARWLFFCLCLSAAALAKPTPREKSTARSLMVSGIGRRDNGDLKGALKDFQQADEIMHVPSTGIEVAKTLVAMGQLMEARDVTQAIAQLPQSSSEPAAFVEARKKARALNDELDARIPTLLVQAINTPGGATANAVFVDDKLYNLSVIASPRRINPGRYNIRVEAGDAVGRAAVEIHEKENKVVTIDFGISNKTGPLHLPLPTPVVKEPEKPRDVEKEKEPEKEKESESIDTSPATKSGGGNTLKYVGYGALGIGAVGVVAGAVTGVMVLSNRSQLDTLCPDGRCPSGEPTDKLNSTRALSTISTVCFIVGGVGLGVGAVALLLHHPKPPPPATTHLTHYLDAYVGPGSIGLRGAF